MAVVLVIDDNPEDQAKIVEILTAEEHTVITASIGTEGLSLCSASKPDMIFLDLIMPEMNGIELLHKLKQEFPDIPVVMCSAAGLEQVVNLALRSGASDYIVKPYHREDIEKMSDEYL